MPDRQRMHVHIDREVSDQFLVACFRLESSSGKGLCLDLDVSERFPRDDFRRVVGMLRDRLSELLAAEKDAKPE